MIAPGANLRALHTGEVGFVDGTPVLAASQELRSGIIEDDAELAYVALP